MKTRALVILFLILGLLGTGDYAFSQNRVPVKTLTLLYSNNINGEIDPCPT
jgi:hypothetical protein